MSPYRRKVLATLGASIGGSLAGCTGQSTYREQQIKFNDNIDSHFFAQLRAVGDADSHPSLSIDIYKRHAPVRCELRRPDGTVVSDVVIRKDDSPEEASDPGIRRGQLEFAGDGDYVLSGQSYVGGFGDIIRFSVEFKRTDRVGKYVGVLYHREGPDATPANETD